MFPFDSFEEQTDDSLVQDPNPLNSSDTENSSAEPVTYVNWLGEVLSPGEVYQDQLGNIYRESDDYVAGTDPWLPDPVAMQEGQSQVWIYPAEEWGYSSPSADTSIDDVIDDVIDSGTTDISYEPSVDSVPDSSMSIDSTDYSYDSSSSSSSSYESDWDSSSTDWSSSSDYDSSSDW